MTNDEPDAIGDRLENWGDTRYMQSDTVADAIGLLAEVERLKQELDARKYVVSAVSVHIKNAAALLKRF